MSPFRWIFRTVRRRRRSPARAPYLQSKESARAFIAERIAYWQSVYPFVFGRFAVKNHSRIWGSCSSLGNLNFNWRLVKLPVELADYVVLHELCHTVEHNHSHRFWALVESMMPDWRTRRAALRHVHPAR
jgi:predicted metal-dependent hydrolase